jgi:hypothetical protein
VYAPVMTSIKFPLIDEDKKMEVLHLHPIELFAGKIKAFYERKAPRDIYDIYTLSKSKILSSLEEKESLRRCVVFYSTLGNHNNRNLITINPAIIRTMPFHPIKTHLLPMLHINAGKYPKEDIDDRVVEYLSSLMVLTDSEKQYLQDFYNGKYNPSLLYPAETANRLMEHPVAKATQHKIYANLTDNSL